MEFKKLITATVVTLAAGAALAATPSLQHQISAPKIDSSTAISGGFAGGATMGGAGLEVGYASMGGTVSHSPQLSTSTGTATQGNGTAVSVGNGSAVFSVGSFSAAGVNNISLPSIQPMR